MADYNKNEYLKEKIHLKNSDTIEGIEFVGYDEEGIFEEDIKEIKEDNKKNKEDNIKRSIRRTKQQIYDICQSNEWEYFYTITLDKQKIDRYNYDILSKKVSQRLKNICKKYDFKYILVPERHKDGAFHFHGLIKGDIKLIDSGKRTKAGDIIYNWENWNLGYSTVTEVKSQKKVAGYITKYITKELVELTKGRKRYWCSKGLNKPEEKNLYIKNYEQYIKQKYDSKIISQSKYEYELIEYCYYLIDLNIDK